MNLEFVISEPVFVFQWCVLVRREGIFKSHTGWEVSGAQFGIEKSTSDSFAQADSSTHRCSQNLFSFYFSMSKGDFNT